MDTTTTKDYSMTRANQVMEGCTAEAAEFVREVVIYAAYQSQLLDLVWDSLGGVGSEDELSHLQAQMGTEAAQIVYCLEKLSDKDGPTAIQLYNLCTQAPDTNVTIDRSGDQPLLVISVAPRGEVPPFGEVTFTHE